MSKICGVLYFKNSRNIINDVKLGLESQIRSGDEKHSVWKFENVGLGQLKNKNKVNQKPGNFSNNSFNNNFVIVSDTVLTNRTELSRKFGVLPSQLIKLTDEDLILKSYEKWGEDCVKQLVGDFAFAIWDKQNKKLFCCRDHFGISTLYFYKDNEKFIFSSEPKGIYSYKGVEKKLNLNKLGSYLLEEPHTLFSNESWFEDIFPFPAGTSFTISSKEITKHKYWKPNNKTSLPYKNDIDIFEAFRELLFEIIESRISSDKTVSSLLSGGLDSSSIVAVAAKILEKQNKEINVFAGVLPDKNDEEFSDERFYIDQFKDFPNVNINYISANNTGPFSNLENLFEKHDSPLVTTKHYLYSAFFQAANKIGAGSLLDGCFGELGATSHSFGGLSEMFTNLNWLKLWRELHLRKKLYNDSIKYNIRAKVLNPLIPKFLINFRHGRIRDEIPFNQYNAINKELAEKLMKNVDVSKHLYFRIQPNHRKNQINDMIFLQEKLTDIAVSNLGSEPVELKYPLLDKRLIEFTLAVPLSLKFKNGYNRYLIRAALDNILPPKIQWRTTKKPFSPDYWKRFNAQINLIKELLADIQPNDPIHEVLEIAKLNKWANLLGDRNKSYSIDEMFANTHNTRTIFLIYFLRTFSEFKT